MTRISNKEKLCTSCGKRQVHAKNLCSVCYHQKRRETTQIKPKPRVKIVPRGKLQQLPQGVVEIAGLLYFDHKFDYNYDDPRILTIQYKASGIRTSTIKLIIADKFPDLKKNSVNNWINYFTYVWTFRKSNGALIRDTYYKSLEVKQMSGESPVSDNPFKFTGSNSFVTANQPLLPPAHRKTKGLTKIEKRLIKDIRNHTDYFYTDNFLKGDIK